MLKELFLTDLSKRDQATVPRALSGKGTQCTCQTLRDEAGEVSLLCF